MDVRPPVAVLERARGVRMPGLDAVLGGSVALAMVYAHQQALRQLVETWNVSPMYSYGFTVPLLSGVLLWSRRAALVDLSPRPSWAAGIAAVAAGLCVSTAARLAGLPVLDQVAFLIGLLGAALLLLGASYVRVGWAALAYLLLMVPVWDGLTESLHQPFQLRSAVIGITLLRLAGIPAYREGTLIALPDATLEIARACSGVNYLVAVLALGLPLAYLYLRNPWRRVILVMTAIAVAALANGLRVALIGALVYYEVGSPLHGPFHTLHGLFVAVVGYIVLFVGLSVLKRTEASAGQEPRTVGTPGDAREDGAPRRFRVRATALSLVAIYILHGGGLLARAVRPVEVSRTLITLPDVLGEWRLQPSPPPLRFPFSAVWAGADVELHGRYVDSRGSAVDMFLGYFAAQPVGRQLAGYLSTEIHGRAVRTLIVSEMPFEANLVHGHMGHSVLFWYELDDRPEASRYAVKARTIVNAVMSGRSNGAVIALIADDSRDDARVLDLAARLRNPLAQSLAQAQGWRGE